MDLLQELGILDIPQALFFSHVVSFQKFGCPTAPKQISKAQGEGGKRLAATGVGCGGSGSPRHGRGRAGRSQGLEFWPQQDPWIKHG